MTLADRERIRLHQDKEENQGPSPDSPLKVWIFVVLLGVIIGMALYHYR
ncbi:MAG: hypothetical protein WC859_03370 [Elusimicrobiota bacterium]|jgi:hypothetical protein